jgi:hypothetical protein
MAKGDGMRTWYYVVGDEKTGPVPEEELIALLKSGELSSGTLVWSEGMDGWITASEIDALVRASFGVPPPLPLASGRTSRDPQCRLKAARHLLKNIFSDEVPLYCGLKRVSCVIDPTRRSRNQILF